MSLWDYMLKVYEKYGYYDEEIFTITHKGSDGIRLIAETMEKLRSDFPKRIGEYVVTEFRDYLAQTKTSLVTGKTLPTNLPKSNVLYFDLKKNSEPQSAKPADAGDAWCCARPSGTEPKIKFYMGVKADNLEDARVGAQNLKEALLKHIEQA